MFLPWDASWCSSSFILLFFCHLWVTEKRSLSENAWGAEDVEDGKRGEVKGVRGRISSFFPPPLLLLLSPCFLLISPLHFQIKFVHRWVNSVVVGGVGYMEAPEELSWSWWWQARCNQGLVPVRVWVCVCACLWACVCLRGRWKEHPSTEINIV